MITNNQINARKSFFFIRKKPEDISMGTGYLKVQVHTGGDTLPVEGAEVVVSSPDGRTLFRTKTDGSGNTEAFRIQAPDARYSLDSSFNGRPYSLVNVVIQKDGFVTMHIRNVQIFDTQTTILPENIEPLAAEAVKASDKYIDIGPANLLSREKNRQNMPPPQVVKGAAGDENADPLLRAAFTFPNT